MTSCVSLIYLCIRAKILRCSRASNDGPTSTTHDGPTSTTHDGPTSTTHDGRTLSYDLAAMVYVVNHRRTPFEQFKGWLCVYAGLPLRWSMMVLSRIIVQPCTPCGTLQNKIWSEILVYLWKIIIKNCWPTLKWDHGDIDSTVISPRNLFDEQLIKIFHTVYACK